MHSISSLLCFKGLLDSCLSIMLVLMNRESVLRKLFFPQTEKHVQQHYLGQCHISDFHYQHMSTVSSLDTEPDTFVTCSGRLNAQMVVKSLELLSSWKTWQFSDGFFELYCLLEFQRRNQKQSLHVWNTHHCVITYLGLRLTVQNIKCKIISVVVLLKPHIQP